jgi:hypothetical protein
MHKYTSLFFGILASLCFLGFVLLGIASALTRFTAAEQVLGTIGGTLLVADMVLVLINDWKGFLTLNGRITWNSDGKRIAYGLVYLIFGPLLLIAYLVQVTRYAPPVPSMTSQERQQ